MKAVLILADIYGEVSRLEIQQIEPNTEYRTEHVTLLDRAIVAILRTENDDAE